MVDGTSLHGGWATAGTDPPPSSLADLLQYASGHYVNHTDWYLRHRDAGFTALAGALTAEFAVAGFAFAGHVRAIVAVAALVTMAVLSAPLTRLAIQSLTQAYKASLEHAALVLKIVWAMGLADAVTTPAALGGIAGCPFARDETLLYLDISVMPWILNTPVIPIRV